MKKAISLLLVVLLCVLMVSCHSSKNQLKVGREVTAQQSDKVSDEKGTTTKKSDKQTSNSTATSTKFPISDSYTAYIKLKSDLTSKITDGLTSNPDTVLASFGLQGVIMIDLIMIPAGILGMGKNAAQSGLGFLGATDIECSESGNRHIIKYKDKDGILCEFEGEYDEAKDSLVCKATKEGRDSLNSEYFKTPFGYVSQYYFVNDDGTVSIYRLAIQGDDGVIGISDVDEYTPLTGNETVDFPKSSKEWYAIFDDAFTGVAKDGTELNFKYIPTDEN